MIRTAAAVLVCLAAAGARTAHAQKLSVTPSFDMAYVYDDNVFSRPAREADTILRLSPHVDGAYQSELLTVSGRYTLDADRFSRHPELVSAHARQDAGVDLQYHSSPRLLFTGAAAFIDTQTPTDLNQQTALTPGRMRAQRLLIHPTATYQAGPRSTTTVGYSMIDDRLAGAGSMRTHTASASIERDLSLRDALQFEYAFHRYLFESSHSRGSQVLTATWTRSLDRLTSLSIGAGPRVSDGGLAPEISASLRRQLRAGEAAIAYVHTQTTVIGLTGMTDTHSLTASLANKPGRRVTLRVAPAILHTTQAGLASTVYRFSASYARPLAHRLDVNASYDMNVQRGTIYAVQGVERISRNVVMLALVVAPNGPAREP